MNVDYKNIDKSKVNIKNPTGMALLHFAAFYGHTDGIEILIRDKSSKMDMQDNDGNTALHYAAVKGHIEAVKKLLACGADSELTNNEGKTPFDYAIGSNSEIIRQTLTAARANTPRPKL